MYRCHFIHEGRVVWGEYLQATDLDGACAEALRLKRQRVDMVLDGFEIWAGSNFVLSRSVSKETILHQDSENISFYL
jgi:hypothetical protein